MAVALAPAYAIAILMTAGPDDGCPSPRQLADALSAHLPGMVLPLGHATARPPCALVSRLTPPAPCGSISPIRRGDPLHRWLPTTDCVRAGDCPALAETAALIIERYWHEVGYDVPLEAPNPAPRPPPPKATAPPPPPAPPPKPAPPPAPPAKEKPEPAAEPARPEPEPPAEPLPPPRYWMGGGAEGLLTTSGDRAGAAFLAIALERPVFGHRLGLRLSAGAETPLSIPVTTGVCVSPNPCSADVLRFPVRMGAYLPISIGFGQLEPGIGIDLGVIAVPFTRGASTETQLGTTPGIDAALGWALQSPHNIFIRALAEAVAEIPYNVVTRSIRHVAVDGIEDAGEAEVLEGVPDDNGLRRCRRTSSSPRARR